MIKAPVKHNRLRRMEKHDYTSSCIYLITVTTEGRQRLLGTLVGDSAATAAIEPTPLGAYVAKAFRQTAVRDDEEDRLPRSRCSIIRSCPTISTASSMSATPSLPITPWVKSSPPGKSACTHALWASPSFSASFSAPHLSAENKTKPLFSRGFNDRILFRRGQLKKTWVAYPR